MSELILTKNIAEARAMLDALEKLAPVAQQVADTLAEALLNGNKLLACGNGGSAADSAHFTTEFVVKFGRRRRPFPAIAFSTNGGDLTAIGNDYEFNDVYSRQVAAFGKPGDVFVGFTTSGNSENVRRALVTAKEMGVTTVAMLGRNGGVCTGLADFELIVRDNITARIQEGHKILIHSICERCEDLFLEAEQNGTLQPEQNA